MAENSSLWSRWSPHVSDAITIVLGIPALIGMAAGIWAYISPSSGLSAALVALVAFMSALWCCIGILWLRDRHATIGSPMPGLNCAWGLEILSFALTHDPGTEQAEWQLKGVFFNRFPWPLRMFVQKCELRVGHISPEQDPFPETGVLVTGQIPMNVAMISFKRGILPQQETYTAKLYLEIIYGFPDAPYSRKMVKEFNLEGRVQRLFPDSLVCPLARVPVREIEEAIAPPLTLPAVAQGL